MGCTDLLKEFHGPKGSQTGAIDLLEEFAKMPESTPAVGSVEKPSSVTDRTRTAPSPDPNGEGMRAWKRSRAEAKAQTHACMEDLIGFLEMHSISGSYALAFAANGVEDLSQLLMKSNQDLDDLIRKSDMDAMDEILFRSALNKGSHLAQMSELLLPAAGRL